MNLLIAVLNVSCWIFAILSALFLSADVASNIYGAYVTKVSVVILFATAVVARIAVEARIRGLFQ